MKVAVEIIKELRDKTGLSVIDCKNALEESDGNVEKAVEVLKKRGMDISAKKAGRGMNEGLIGTYVHLNGKIGVLVEVNCESDFVARTDDFKELVKDISLQIAAMNPKWLTRELVPEEMIEERKKMVSKEFKNKPANILDKITEGKLKEFFEETVLLDQKFIKDENINIQDYISSKVAKLGENIAVNKFVRFQIGK